MCWHNVPRSNMGVFCILVLYCRTCDRSKHIDFSFFFFQYSAKHRCVRNFQMFPSSHYLIWLSRNKCWNFQLDLKINSTKVTTQATLPPIIFQNDYYDDDDWNREITISGLLFRYQISDIRGIFFFIGFNGSVGKGKKNGKKNLKFTRKIKRSRFLKN